MMNFINTKKWLAPALVLLFSMILFSCGDDGYNDDDRDGVINKDDNCPVVWNAGQQDNNADGIGNACTPATFVADPASIEIVNSIGAVSTQIQHISITALDPDGQPYPYYQLSITHDDQAGNVSLYDGNIHTPPPLRAVTDDNGTYDLRVDLKVGGGLDYTVNISVQGFDNTLTIPVHVSAG